MKDASFNCFDKPNHGKQVSCEFKFFIGVVKKLCPSGCDVELLRLKHFSAVEGQ